LTTNTDSRACDKTKEGLILLDIVEFAEIVKEAIEQIGHLFTNDPEKVHFAEYLTGLMVVVSSHVDFSKTRPFVKDKHGYIKIDDDAWLGTHALFSQTLQLAKRPLCWYRSCHHKECT
jgi:hypothetical protein